MFTSVAARSVRVTGRIVRQCSRAQLPAVFTANTTARQWGAKTFATDPSATQLDTDLLLDNKAIDGRIALLEGMLLKATPNIDQICQTMTDLSRTPYGLNQVLLAYIVLLAHTVL